MGQQIDTVDEDEITLKELIWKGRAFFKRIRREKRFIVRFLFITIPIGLLLAFGTTPEYTASMRIMPYRAPGGGSSGLSGLAGLAGIKIPSRGAEETVQPEMYPDIAKSADFCIALAETPIYFKNYGKKVTSVQYHLELKKPSFADYVKKYTIGIPKTIIGWFRTSPQEETLSDPSIPNYAKYSQDYLLALEAIKGSFSVTPEMIKGYSAVTSLKIEATMPDPMAAAGMAQAAADQLMDAVIEVEIKKVSDELVFLEEHHKKMHKRYVDAQMALARFKDRTRGTTSATVLAEEQRLQSDFNLAFELLRNVSQELEQAKIKLNRETPVFTVLENVIVPNTPSAPRKSRILILSVFLGVFFGVGYIGWRSFMEQINEN
jgi:hypothetical protein